MGTPLINEFLSQVINNLPKDWLDLTTHRLDIYNEEKAKSEFLEQFENLYKSGSVTRAHLEELPTAYDYIRLGHPLSSVLEWGIAKDLGIQSDQVISFASQTIGILAILRKNAIDGIKTRLIIEDSITDYFDIAILKSIYNYDFDVVHKKALTDSFTGSTIYVSNSKSLTKFDLQDGVDFYINFQANLGSVLVISNANRAYVPDIQHVRRRETIAMTPVNCLEVLKGAVSGGNPIITPINREYKTQVVSLINQISNTTTPALVGSSGLSVQYAIMMGLVEHAKENYPKKTIAFIVPPNCYGGTNDQARRVAASVTNVKIVDLPVDRDNDMVRSVENVLTQMALEDTIPYIIAEIPTNPRVEVPKLKALQQALSKSRTTPSGTIATPPVFILDQTFCPNVHFLGDENILGNVQAIAYASGSKFPSGGKCTAGYCVANTKAAHFFKKIESHLLLCDNEATSHQYEILASQMPSMIDRIAKAYENTREFVSYIEKELPEAKINFVSKRLANEGFTPSVFSLDLPTIGTSPEEQEAFKRAMNHKLINLMISNIPDQSKYCVSYGQLKGVYWTIPATSTQGTTKEGDKDYIIRASFAPQVDLDRHKAIFKKFVEDAYAFAKVH